MANSAYVYLRHLSAEYQLTLSVNPLIKCWSTYQLHIGWYIGKHSTVVMLTNIGCPLIDTHVRWYFSNTQPILCQHSTNTQPILYWHLANTLLGSCWLLSEFYQEPMTFSFIFFSQKGTFSGCGLFWTFHAGKFIFVIFVFCFSLICFSRHLFYILQTTYGLKQWLIGV